MLIINAKSDLSRTFRAMLLWVESGCTVAFLQARWPSEHAFSAAELSVMKAPGT